MNGAPSSNALPADHRTAEVRGREGIFRCTERMFILLMGTQWLIGLVLAMWLSPLNWGGSGDHADLKLWLALLLGGAFSALPTYLALSRADTAVQRGKGERQRLGRCERRAAAVLESALDAILTTDGRGRIRAHLEEGKPYDLIYRLRTKAGPYRWFRARGQAQRDAGGRPVRMAGSNQDVTDQRTAEEGLRESAERLKQANAELEARTLELERARAAAESANRAKSEFLATMSHEIRTPMNGILGMTEILLGCTLPVEQREYARSIHSCSRSLLAILDDVLDLSKIEAGRVELEAIDFDPRTPLEEVLDLLAPAAREKGLVLCSRVDPAVPRCVRGDPERLRQVLFNLVVCPRRRSRRARSRPRGRPRARHRSPAARATREQHRVAERRAPHAVARMLDETHR